jgi:hypothetical protein
MKSAWQRILCPQQSEGAFVGGGVFTPSLLVHAKWHENLIDGRSPDPRGVIGEA